MRVRIASSGKPVSTTLMNMLSINFVSYLIRDCYSSLAIRICYLIRRALIKKLILQSENRFQAPHCRYATAAAVNTSIMLKSEKQKYGI